MAYTLLSVVTPRVVFIGAGTLGPFTLGAGFRVRTSSQLVVTRYSSTTDTVGTALVLNTDFTANVTDADNVTITLIAPQVVLASTERLVVERTQPVAGVIEYSSGGNFSGPTLGDAISVHTEQIQELRRDIDRSIRAHNLDTTVSTFPLKANASSGDLLAFDTDKNLTSVTPSSIGITTVNLGTGWSSPLTSAIGARWSAHLGKDLAQFYLDDYYSTTWQAALDAANTAAAAAGGGIIYATGREEYAFTGYPSALTAGVYVFGIPNFTRFKMPTTGGTLIQWTGGAVGSSKTLSGNVAAGDETIGVTSGSDIAAGDFLRMIKTDVALTIGHPSQIFRVEAKPSANSITVANRVRFATLTSDTYTLSELTLIGGGGLYGIIFDGSACTATTCVGCFAQYMNGGYFDAIGGENMTGSDPANNSSDCCVIKFSDCWDTRGLNDIWAYKSGTAGTCDIQFNRMGPTQYGDIHSEQSTGFGPGWYDSSDQQDIRSIYSLQARQRAGKVQCSSAVIGRIVVDKPTLTGFAFSEGATADIGSVEYSNTDAPTAVSVVSLVRVSNVVTITIASDPYWVTGRTIVIAGATSADDMNGAVSVTRLTATTYTYSDAGVNETATGTITATPQATPSLWLDAVGSNVVNIQSARFWGITNSGGDLHAGSTDSLWVGSVNTQWGTAPTYGGTATVGTQIIVRELNNQLQAIGFSTSTYLTAQDFTATSGQTGFKAIIKDSGGTSRTGLVYINTSGNMLVQAPSTKNLYLYGAGAYVQNSLFAETDATNDIGATAATRFRDLHVSRGIRASGRDVIDAQGYNVFSTATAANIASISNAINTTGKAQGRAVLDTTNHRLMIADGATAGALWWVSDGSASVTPV